MKIISGMLERLRPLFEEGGRLSMWNPVFRAADNFFFSSPGKTATAPFGRDPLDVKRYMSLVIVALFPSFIASLYYFGPRVLLMILTSYVAGGIVEVLFAIVRKEEINEGFLVTGFIFPMILPPALPLWLVALGIVFGVLVGKEVFGGTGRNLFNPALVGRCFLALGYPAAMTQTWITPDPGRWGRLFSDFSLSVHDAVTSATPLVLAKGGELSATRDLLIGNVTGSVGETSAVAIAAGGVFLVAVGVANWRTVLGILVSFIGFNALFRGILPAQVSPVLFNVLSGGILFGAFFMATDPVTSPITQWGKWAYGILIGAMSVLIRSFSGYVEGVMFAILLGNICAPLIDEAVIRIRIRRYGREG